MSATHVAEASSAHAGVIQILLDQHNLIKELFSLVESSEGEARQEEFDHLRALLAVHETAEEEVLRPVTRSVVPQGDAVADARVAEENEAKEVLAELEKLGADSPDFLPKFRSFKQAVLAHAVHEESEEFPAVQAAKSPEELEKLGKRIRMAEKMAPTHPHPSVKSTTANYLIGPFAAMLDRVRDAMKHDDSG